MNPKNKAKYTFKKAWSWPGEVESKIKDLCEGRVLHVCCGDSKLGDVRVDSDSKRGPDIVCDMFHLTEHPDLKPMIGKFDTVLCDPPWELPYHLRGKLLRQCRDMLKPNGRLIFNCFWFPKTRGLSVDPEIYVGVPHNLWRNASLLITARRMALS